MSRVLSSSFDLLRILAVTSALFGAVACVPQAPAGASTESEASGNLGAVGAACSHSRNCNDGLACVNGACTTPDSCGGITAAGRCDPSGRILSWCSDGTLNTIDCAGDPGSEGSVCVDGPVEARCVPAAAPPGCGSVPAAGVCSGTKLFWCGTNGELFDTDCAYDTGFTCEMIDGEAECVPMPL